MNARPKMAHITSSQRPFLSENRYFAYAMTAAVSAQASKVSVVMALVASIGIGLARYINAGSQGRRGANDFPSSYTSNTVMINAIAIGARKAHSFLPKLLALAAMAQ